MFSLVGGPSVSFVSFLAPGFACLCLCLLSKVLLCSPSSACLVSLCRSVPSSLPPSLPPPLPSPPSLPPSLTPSFGGRGSGGARDVTGAPLSAPEPPPPASPWNVPPTTLESRGGSASPSGQPPEEIVPSSSPFLCGRGRVASRGSEAEEAPARARAFGRPARWLLGGRRQRPVLGTVEPVVRSHLAAAFILSLPSGASARPSGGL